MEVVEQGNRVAEQDRRRLSLGHNPIPDISDLINSQNIWASGAELPEDTSVLFPSPCDQGFNQSSSSRPGMLWKSFVLFVTSDRP
jgi:hypothetical protein